MTQPNGDQEDRELKARLEKLSVALKGKRSDLQGAAYAVSEAIISPQGLLTWDRGFDAAGKQVWGATKGGYDFVRQTPLGAPPAAPATGPSPKPAR